MLPLAYAGSMRNLGALTAIFGLLALFTVIALVIPELGDLTDQLTLTGGLKTLVDRLEFMYLIVGGLVLVGTVLAFVAWVSRARG